MKQKPHVPIALKESAAKSNGAIQHPEKVRRVAVISSPYARSGWYPEAQQGMNQVGAAMADNMMQTPAGRFSNQWPEPQRFPQFLDKMGKMMSEDYNWSAEVANLQMPVLLVFPDNDSISQKHIVDEKPERIGPHVAPSGRVRVLGTLCEHEWLM